MGFLKFLKKQKSSNLDELDLPPAPPPLEGFEEDLPELHDFPELGKISAPKEEPRFDFESEQGQQGLSEEMPELPEMPDIEGQSNIPYFPEMEEKLIASAQPAKSAIPEPAFPIAQRMPETAPPAEEKQSFAPDAYPRMAGRLFAKEKRALHQVPRAKTVYVRVDKFKTALGSINMVRSDLRKSEEALVKLENIKNSKDKSFDRVRGSLDDLQKKLIFIDKTLFKSD